MINKEIPNLLQLVIPRTCWLHAPMTAHSPKWVHNIFIYEMGLEEMYVTKRKIMWMMRRTPLKIWPAAPVFPFVLDLVSCRPVLFLLVIPGAVGCLVDKLLAVCCLQVPSMSIIPFFFWALKNPDHRNKNLLSRRLETHDHINQQWRDRKV